MRFHFPTAEHTTEPGPALASVAVGGRRVTWGFVNDTSEACRGCLLQKVSSGTYVLPGPPRRTTTSSSEVSKSRVWIVQEGPPRKHPSKSTGDTKEHTLDGSSYMRVLE